MYKVLDLFSGIGGFSLGLERTGGFKTVAFCEIDETARKVLRKHWPDTPIFHDVTKLTKRYDMLEYGEGSVKIGELGTSQVDVICGGFPCQDISIGGKGKGIKGSRSGLWSEFRRLIDEVKPKYAIIENVERLRKKGLGIVLRDLHKIGYNAEWHCITARCIGLPHQRDRLWIIAYPRSKRQYECIREKRFLQVDKKRKDKTLHANWAQCKFKPREVCTILSKRDIENIKNTYSNEFSIVPELYRVTDGVPEGLDENRRKQRIKQLGNSIVPQIAEMIGRAVLNDAR
jgi:DNA (cytosine-5)-methyltransferase 1